MSINLKEIKLSINEDMSLTECQKESAINSLNNLENKLKITSLPQNHIINNILSNRIMYVYLWIIYLSDILKTLDGVPGLENKLSIIKKDSENVNSYLLELEVASKFSKKYELNLNQKLNDTKLTPDISATNKKKHFIIEITNRKFSDRRKKTNSDYQWISSFLMETNKDYIINGELNETLSKSDRNYIKLQVPILKNHSIKCICYKSSNVSLNIVPRSSKDQNNDFLYRVNRDEYFIKDMEHKIECKAKKYNDKCENRQELIIFLFCTEIYHYTTSKSNLIGTIEEILAKYNNLTAVVLCAYDFGYDMLVRNKKKISENHILLRITRVDYQGVYYWIIGKNSKVEELLCSILRVQ